MGTPKSGEQIKYVIPGPTPDYEYFKWEKCDLWTINEAIYLLLDIEPYRGAALMDVLGKMIEIVEAEKKRTSNPSLISDEYFRDDDTFKLVRPLGINYIRIKNQFVRSMKSGKFKTLQKVNWYDYDNDFENIGMFGIEQINPAEVVNWAADKGFKIPDQLKSLLKIPSDNLIADTAKKPRPGKPRKKRITSEERALEIEIRQLWDVYKKSGYKETALTKAVNDTGKLKLKQITYEMLHDKSPYRSVRTKNCKRDFANAFKKMVQNQTCPK